MTSGGVDLPTSRKAIYSVIFGGAAFACAFLSPFFAFVLAVPALTCGVHARREISASKGAEGGDMAAVIGLTMGATTLGLVVISWLVAASFTT
jgi:hypothetical protein